MRWLCNRSVFFFILGTPTNESSLATRANRRALLTTQVAQGPDNTDALVLLERQAGVHVGRNFKRPSAPSGKAQAQYQFDHRVKEAKALAKPAGEAT